MATMNEISVGTIVEINNEPFKVIGVTTSKISQAKNVMKMKLKSLSSAKVINHSLQGSDKIQLAVVSNSEAQFLYSDDQGFHFMDNTTFEQFSLSQKQIGNGASFLKEGTTVTVVHSHEKPIALDLPIKIDLKVIQAPPGIRGDTAQGGSKEVETETGFKVSTPLFIKEGDIIRINTETGAYVERVK